MVKEREKDGSGARTDSGQGQRPDGAGSTAPADQPGQPDRRDQQERQQSEPREPERDEQKQEQSEPEQPEQQGSHEQEQEVPEQEQSEQDQPKPDQPGQPEQKQPEQDQPKQPGRLERLKKIAGRLPRKPGVYLFKDGEGRVLYVGKARNLRSRVRSYFSKGGDGRYHIRFLKQAAEELEFLVTGNEKEALLLECTLIKKHRPRYNVQLRDDKNYVLVRVDRKHPYPRLQIVRRVAQDGARYFGPFTSAKAARQTVRFASRHFSLRICSDSELARRKTPCLHGQIVRLPVPCCEEVTPEEYGERVDNAVLLLSGRGKELVSKLEQEMQEASDALEFERAAMLRDLIQSIERVGSGQDVVSTKRVDRDIFGIARDGSRVEVCLLEVRAGLLSGRRNFELKRQQVPDEDWLRSFIALYYVSGRLPPPQILVPLELEDAAAIEDLLTERRMGRVRISVPKRGSLRRLLDMANKNAEESLARRRSEPDPVELIEGLAAKLSLPRVPVRMECYDVSTFQGSQTRVSMVVFREGHPDKAAYRVFSVEQEGRPDDYGALRAALTRRLRRGLDGQEGWELPDLIVMDGGKGQLGVALASIVDLGLGAKGPGLVAIAKGPPPILEERSAAAKRAGLGKADEPAVKDHLFLPGVKDPISVRGRELLLLAAIRDEAHRFALKHHRKARRSEGLTSLLESIPGIGPGRRKRLLETFGSVDAMAGAGLEELMEAGLPRAVAERMNQWLQENVLDSGGVGETDTDPGGDQGSDGETR